MVDFGVNSAALVELAVPAEACPLQLRLAFAEAIHSNGSLYHHIQGISTEISTFSCGAAAGGGGPDRVTYRSHWTQMGFRYAEVTQVGGPKAFDLASLNVSSLVVSTGFDQRKQVCEKKPMSERLFGAGRLSLCSSSDR